MTKPPFIARRVIIMFVVALTCIACTASSTAQTLTIRVLNGKSGKPMKGQKIIVHWDNTPQSTEVALDDEGTARVEVIAGAKQFMLALGPRQGQEPHRVAYINCNKHASEMMDVTDVVSRGVVPSNSCGSRSLNTRQGEVVFWAAPRPFFDFQ